MQSDRIPDYPDLDSDNDNDGLPDVWRTLEPLSDADGDGIDDFADAEYVNATDTDGDGIIDRLDADFDGTGYYPSPSKMVKWTSNYP